jgi:hypothetical protein
VLWPPDGLNLKQGTCGELFGYGYLALPLTKPKSTTAGKNVPTGNHCWTLFLNTRNFKGPVAFFTPYFWSHTTVADPCLAGMLPDSRPAGPNRAMQMETQYVPSVQAVDEKGQTYARVAPTSFPRDGVEVVKDTQPQGGLVPSAGGLHLGAEGTALVPFMFWSGLIDDVRIYDRAVKP